MSTPALGYDALYDALRSTIERTVLDTGPRTTIEQFRHTSHDATFEVMRTIATAVRALEPDVAADTVTYAGVLLLLGERP